MRIAELHDPIEATTRRRLSPAPAPGQVWEPLDGTAKEARASRVTVAAVAGERVTVRDDRGAIEQVDAEVLAASYWLVANSDLPVNAGEEHIGAGRTATRPVPPTAESDRPGSAAGVAALCSNVPAQPSVRSRS